nr:hypothetical protein [Mycolicibacterium neoaurum]
MCRQQLAILLMSNVISQSPWGSTGVGDRWCSRRYRAATGCADRRSTPALRSYRSTRCEQIVPCLGPRSVTFSAALQFSSAPLPARRSWTTHHSRPGPGRS